MAVWTAAFINDLPDGCFAYIEPGGTKDVGGKTVPRSLRHFPYKNESGDLDTSHVRNALARIPQSNVSADAKAKSLAIIRRAAAKLGIGDYGAKEGIMNFNCYSNLREAEIVPAERLIKHIRIIEADKRTINGTYYPFPILREAINLFEGALTFHTHIDPDKKSTRDIVGKIHNVRAGAQGLEADMTISESESALWTKIQEGLITDISIDAMGKTHITKVGSEAVRMVEKINKVHSVDLVVEASAGGQILEAIKREENELTLIENMSLKELIETRPDLLEEYKKGILAEKPKDKPADPSESIKETVMGILEPIRKEAEETAKKIREEMAEVKKEGETQLTEMVKRNKATMQAMEILAESKLPVKAQERIRESVIDEIMGGGDGKKAIESERTYLTETTGKKFDTDPGTPESIKENVEKKSIALLKEFGIEYKEKEG